MKREITAYVTSDGDLVTIDTAERLRRATTAERRESYADRTGTGAIRTSVSERTLLNRAPDLCAQVTALGHW